MTLNIALNSVFARLAKFDPFIQNYLKTHISISNPLLFLALFWTQSIFACTDEFKPVCGYWMHSPKRQTFINECKMREAGAKIRHAGTCSDSKQQTSVQKPTSK